MESFMMESEECPEAVFDIETDLNELFDIFSDDDEEHLDDDDLSVTAGKDFDRIQVTRLLSAAFYLKHGLSKSGLGDFLDILNVSSELYQDEELRSPYMFMNKYGILNADLKRIYPCSTCSKTLEN
ncbi:Uncharacterized protein APZ42_007903, partial [Daphnia magna]